MSTTNTRLAQRLIAIVVIVAILGVVGFSPPVILFFVVAGFIIWRTVRRSEHNETERIFEFYIAADEVLRDETRQWYGFEISEVIEMGERVVISLPDPPPLIRFTLGALYHRAGDFEPAVEHLAWLAEDARAKEVHLTIPSPQLRRYVEALRRIEREPSIAPQTLAAIRNLERTRRKRADEILAQSRSELAAAEIQKPEPVARDTQKNEGKNAKPLSLLTAPPPISEVLRDVYQTEDKKTA